MAKAGRKPKSNTLQTRITYLEMDTPLGIMPPVPTKPPIALIRAENIPASYYSYLYEHVGKHHHWEDRRNLAGEALEVTVNAKEVEVSILYVEGCAAGFFELDLSQAPNAVEIKYLGLMPNYQGFGLGKWFVAAAVKAAWLHKPEKVIIETNTLDHPAALPLYQKLGFSPVGIGEAEITEWK